MSLAIALLQLPSRHKTIPRPVFLHLALLRVHCTDMTDAGMAAWAIMHLPAGGVIVLASWTAVLAQQSTSIISEGWQCPPQLHRQHVCTSAGMSTYCLLAFALMHVFACTQLAGNLPASQRQVRAVVCDCRGCAVHSLAEFQVFSLAPCLL